MPREFKVVAIIAAHNEQDIIGQVVTDLIDQGVHIYFLDDWSTDETVSIVERHVGRGVLAIERLGASPSREFNWQKILQRKEALAVELDADWFIHHDADEFRESPWAGLSLAHAIEKVDRSGYNAIGFALFDFWPTGEDVAPGSDVRHTFRYYEPPREWNKLQVRCWKKRPERVDLVSSGGHDVLFPNRRVYPLRFILRHYPIRGSEHGRRKVFVERLPRFTVVERMRDWHIQYDAYGDGASFVRDPAAMTLYDPAAARADVASEDIQRLDGER